MRKLWTVATLAILFAGCANEVGRYEAIGHGCRLDTVTGEIACAGDRDDLEPAMPAGPVSTWPPKPEPEVEGLEGLWDTNTDPD